MADVSLAGLSKHFGPSVAVSDVTMEIDDGELVAFLGPSGCGKTTTLRMIAGFIAPTAGSIRIGGADMTALPVHRRDTGMVFQRYALFPHMTVAENVAFGLQMRKLGAAEREKRIQDVLELVRMGALRDRYPRQLSGGQQQRVAIARALAIQPKVFLLDEPLSNLDAKLRLEVRDEIRSLQQRLGLTTIFVTHDQEEALAIADRMVIMHDGRVQQVGTPKDLYERPANLFVADFLGKMNLLTGRGDGAGAFVTEHGTRLLVNDAPMVAAASSGTGTSRSSGAKVGVRPERVLLHTTAPPTGAEPVNALAARIEAVAYLGPHIDVRLRLDSGDSMVSRVPNGMAGLPALASGTRVLACFRAADCVGIAD
jgi:putative spermidine/putrescine transport system ATP-binding protein